MNNKLNSENNKLHLINSRNRIDFVEDEDKENVYRNQSIYFKKLVSEPEGIEVLEGLFNINNKNNDFRIKHEPLEEEDSETDFISLNSRNRIVFKEDIEHLYEAQCDKIILLSKPRNNSETTCKRLNQSIKEECDIKYESHKSAKETDLVSLNSRNSIIFKEDIDCLYENHDVKEEITLGPELIQHNFDDVPLQHSVLKNNKISTAQRVQKEINCDNNCEKIHTNRSEHNVYTCDHCKKEFDTYFKILCHIKKTHSNVFSKMNHCNTRNTQKKYDQVCEICEKKFCLKESLRLHMKMHKEPNENTNKICNICTKIFATVAGLAKHINNVHNGKKPFNCKCGKSFTHKRDFESHYLKKHSRYHPITAKPIELPTYICKYCKKQFTDKSGYHRHEKYYCTMNENKELQKKQTKKNNLPSKFICDLCQKAYRDKYTLRIHMKTHFGTVIAYQCDVCNKTYSRKSGLKGHILSKHLNLRVYACDKCKNTFTSRWSLLCHQRRNCSIKHQCNMCNLGFRNIDNLTKHIKKHPSKIQTYQCDMCNKVYSYKANLRNHIQNKHMKLRVYTCNKCKHTFASFSGLRWHQKNSQKTCNFS